MFHRAWINYGKIHSSQPPSPLLPLWEMGDGGGWLGIGTLDRGDFFQVGLENSLYKK